MKDPIPTCKCEDRPAGAGVGNAAAASRTANTLLVTSPKTAKVVIIARSAIHQAPRFFLEFFSKSFHILRNCYSASMSADAPSFADGSGFGSAANGSNAGKKAVHVKVRWSRTHLWGRCFVRFVVSLWSSTFQAYAMSWS
jgi:hypothetical protein